MELTDRAEALWARYEAEVRARLGGRGDVDVTDILTGVREHVEAELGRRGVERATAEDLSEVLDRLGGPDQWDDPGTTSSDRAAGAATTGGPPAPRWPGIAALVFTLVGGALLLLGFWWAWTLGWGLLVAGVVLARLSLDDADPESRPAVDGSRPARSRALPGPTRRLALLIWWTATVVGVLALLAAPAVLTWVAAQIGGPLEQALPGRPGVPGGPSTPDGCWRLPMLIGASTTAVWWLVLAGLSARFGAGARRVLGPARSLLPDAAARALTMGAAVALLTSLLAGALL